MTTRDFPAVLAAVIATVPEDEPTLRLSLANVQRKAARHPPELAWQMVGLDAQYILGIHFAGMTDEERAGWRGKVLAAWTGSAT